MNPADPQPADSPDDALDERLGELINEFFDRRSRGEPISEDSFLAENPQHADVLREHLRGLHLLEPLSKSGASSSADDTLARPMEGHFGGSSARSNGGESNQPIPTVAGYEVQKPIGRGGMGLVYRAIQISTRRVVALKVLLEGPFATEMARRRFEREISLAAGLRHPNIIPIYDSGTSDGRMYYAMEFIYGLPLSDYLRVHNLSIRDSLQLMLKVFAAVGYAHQRGVVHRDLKPSNILVDGEGEPHILDFGLAKSGALGDVTTSISAPIIGTPAYMSPEQASADPNSVDIRTDVYSLGVVLYEAVCKKLPYDTSGAIGKALQNIAHAEPTFPTKHNPKIDAELAAIALKALEKNKDNRYQSVDGFAQDVRHYLAGEPISAKQATGTYLLKKAVLKHRALVGVCAGLLAMFGISWWTVRQFSRVSTEKEGLHERLARIEEDSAKKDAAIQELVKQGGGGSSAVTDVVLGTLDPQEAKLAQFMRSISGKTRDEQVVSLLAFIASNVPATSESDSTSFKTPNVEEFDRPLASPRPSQYSSTASQPATESAEYQRILQMLQDSAIRAALANQATSQPASSQPSSVAATSQSAQPPTSQPTESAASAPPPSSQPSGT
ncbi:Serine/threonine-protein kinase PrkC [Phycisphaerae bacterium RAS2]|nr:Serine/threonine-protein kinase PrkC [Phycisphaerae bacterium RAS2]